MAEDRWIVADHNGVYYSQGSDKPREVEVTFAGVVRSDGGRDFYGKTNALTGEDFFLVEDTDAGVLHIATRDQRLVSYGPTGWLRIERVLDDLSVSRSMS